MFLKIRSLFDKTRSFSNNPIEFFSFEFCAENLKGVLLCKDFLFRNQPYFSSR